MERVTVAQSLGQRVDDRDSCRTDRLHIRIAPGRKHRGVEHVPGIPQAPWLAQRNERGRCSLRGLEQEVDAWLARLRADDDADVLVERYCIENLTPLLAVVFVRALRKRHVVEPAPVDEALIW